MALFLLDNNGERASLEEEEVFKIYVGDLCLEETNWSPKAAVNSIKPEFFKVHENIWYFKETNLILKKS